MPCSHWPAPGSTLTGGMARRMQLVKGRAQERLSNSLLSFRGGTGSDAVILDQRGEIVVKSVGPATNP